MGEKHGVAVAFIAGHASNVQRTSIFFVQLRAKVNKDSGRVCSDLRGATANLMGSSVNDYFHEIFSNAD
jgi:hypothetical protein